MRHKAPWGYFHYLDGPPAVGGGVGCFAWFESRDALFAFIVHHQAWIGAPEADTAPAERAEQVQAQEIDMEQARLQINELLRTFSQIEWWGRADELLAGDGDFARELREWYRDFSRIEPVDGSPIAAAAKELEINPSTLYRKAKSLNIELPKAVPAATRVTNAGRNYRLCYPSRVAQPPKKSINDAGAF